MDDSYKVLESTSESEIKIKGSRFIARAFFVQSRDDVDYHLSDIKRIDRDATHHCMAFRLGPEGSVSRVNDDGEPSGTAGKPILRQIEALGVTNALVVVTRYYGGTKLGTGGLVRAYGQASKEALQMASVKTVIQHAAMSIAFDYADTSGAMYVINKYGAKIDETIYGDRTQIRLRVRRSHREQFIHAFEDALSGRGAIILEEQD